jgi:hypothetical protein
VIDSPSQVRLQEIVRRESRSLLQYAREVPLWAAPKERPALAQLHEIARTEGQATDALATWLQRHHAGILHLGPYASNYLSLNDMGLCRLLPRITQDHARLLLILETDAAALAGVMNGQSVLSDLVSLKRRHADELRSMSPADRS